MPRADPAPAGDQQRAARVATVARRRLTPEQRTEELLAAAEEIVIESGVESLTLEQVAEKAGCSRNLAYTYFSNREHLLSALVDREREHLLHLVIERVPRPSDIGEWLRAWVAVVLDEAARRGNLLMLVDEHRDEMQRRHTRDLLSEALTERLRNDLGYDDARAITTARILIGAMKGAILALVVDGVPVEAVEAELEARFDSLLSIQG